MKILSRKKQHEIILMLASIASYTQNGDINISLDKIYDLIIEIAYNVDGAEGIHELAGIAEAINRQADQMVEIFNMKTSISNEKDGSNEGLPN